MSEFRKVARGALLVFLASIIGAVFSYFSKVLIARILGPEKYGLFVLSLTIVYIFSAFSQSGVSPAISYFIPKYRKRKEFSRILSTLIWIAILPLFFVSLFFILFPNLVAKIFGEPKIFSFIPYILLFMIEYTLVNLTLNIFRGYENAEVPQLISIMRSASFFVVGVWLTYVYRTSLMPLVAYIMVYTLLLVILTFLVKNLIKLSKPGIKYIREISIFSISMFFVGILSLILRWTDVWMISLFKNSAYVGIYNVATTTGFTMIYFINAFLFLYFPIATRLISSGKRREVRKLSTKIVFWNSIVTIPIFFLVFVFSKQVIYVLFGMKYIQASIPLSILAMGVLVLNILNISSNSLLAMNRKREILISSLIAATMNVVLNYILIPVYGLVGAATATAISLSTGKMINYFYSYKHKVYPNLKPIVKPLAIGLILIVPIYLISVFYSFSLLEALGLAFSYLLIYLLFINFAVYPIKKLIKSVISEIFESSY